MDGEWSGVGLLAQRRPVAALSREQRVELLVLARDALLTGAALPEDARRFLADALDAWLTLGGDLEALLGVRAVRGSHATARFLAARFRARLEQQADPSSR